LPSMLTICSTTDSNMVLDSKLENDKYAAFISIFEDNRSSFKEIFEEIRM
jgi:hypothetical protein